VKRTEVLCESIAAACRCTLVMGHDGPHVCNPEVCAGRWTGSDTTGDFAAVTPPFGGDVADDPLGLAALLVGLMGGDFGVPPYFRGRVGDSDV
jgi:hypothetical protein